MDAREQQVLAEVSYHDLFDRPLTLLELSRLTSLSQLNTTCENLMRQGKLENSVGFYCLPGRTNIVETRMKRYAISDSKLRAAWKKITWLAAMPGVEALFLCNTMATLNATKQSDIDFFIVARPGRIFSARFWTVLFARFFGTRPDAHDHTDRAVESATHNANALCLSFFVSNDAINIQRFSISTRDVYLRHWSKEIVPLYDPRNVYERFRRQNDVRSSKVWPSVHRRVALRWYHKLVTAALCIASFIIPERLVETIQWKKLPTSIKAQVNKGTAVMWKREVLKFHDNDRRQQYYEGWRSTLETLL